MGFKLGIPSRIIWPGSGSNAEIRSATLIVPLSDSLSVPTGQHAILPEGSAYDSVHKRSSSIISLVPPSSFLNPSSTMDHKQLNNFLAITALLYIYNIFQHP